MSKRSRIAMLFSVVALAGTIHLAIADTNIRFTAVTFLDPATLRLAWLDDTNALSCTDTVGAVSSRFYRISASPEPTNRFYVVERCDRLGQPFSPFALVIGTWSGNTTTNQGTEMDDSLIFFGTEAADYVIQWGDAGNDSLYVSANSADDVLDQKGGAGNDTMTGIGGTGNDAIFLDGGPGDDSIYGEGGDGSDWIQIRDEGGHNVVTGYLGYHDDTTRIETGAGNDWVRWNLGDGNDLAAISVGGGDDTITYDCAAGQDIVQIDGEADSDTLTININSRFYAIYDAEGNLLHQNGTPGTSITVVNLEQIVCKRPDDSIEWQWP